MRTNFVIFLATTPAAMAVLDDKILVQSGAFGKLEDDGRLVFQKGPGCITAAVEIGNFILPYQFQALIQSSGGKPRLQLNSFQDWEKYRDFFVGEVVHLNRRYGSGLSFFVAVLCCLKISQSGFESRENKDLRRTIQ